MKENKSGYATTDTRPRVWAVKSDQTGKILDTHEVLGVLKDKWGVGGLVYTKIPKDLHEKS